MGSLHTRLDEASEMTNTGVVPAGPFRGARTARAPRDAGGPPFALSARTKPRIKGGAPIANRVRMGPRQLSCYRSPDPRILSRRRRIWSRGGRTRRPDVGRRLSPQPETQQPMPVRACVPPQRAAASCTARRRRYLYLYRRPLAVQEAAPRGGKQRSTSRALCGSEPRSERPQKIEILRLRVEHAPRCATLTKPGRTRRARASAAHRLDR